MQTTRVSNAKATEPVWKPEQATLHADLCPTDVTT
jgi:hypothetical protein